MCMTNEMYQSISLITHNLLEQQYVRRLDALNKDKKRSLTDITASKAVVVKTKKLIQTRCVPCTTFIQFGAQKSPCIKFEKLPFHCIIMSTIFFIGQKLLNGARFEFLISIVPFSPQHDYCRCVTSAFFGFRESY